MRNALAVAAFALLATGCQTPIERGERLYRQGDRLGALEVWRAVPESDARYRTVREHIAVLEDEFEQLVVRYKQRGRYFEDKGRLAESILNYRLALKLQPGDAATLARVQELARTLAARKAELSTAYRQAFEDGDLGAARAALEMLRTLDAFDPDLENDERQLELALRAEVTRRLASGRQAFAVGNFAAARRELRAVLALEPANESARGYLAYIATVDQETSGEPVAFDARGPFASDAEVRAEGFYQSGLAAERLGDLYASIRHDLRALEADPQHRRARDHLNRLRASLGDEVEPLIEAGREAFRQEDLQTALDLWRQALLIEPANERTQAYIARAERQLANLERLRSDPDVASSRE